MRTANDVDFCEDLYLSIRELVEVFGVTPRGIRRWVNQSLKAVPPSPIRDRVWTADEKTAGRSLPETEGGGLRCVSGASFRASNGGKTAPGRTHTPSASAGTRGSDKDAPPGGGDAL